MPKKDEVLFAMVLSALAGFLCAFLALKIVSIPTGIKELGFAFAWIVGSLLMFFIIIFMASDMRSIRADAEESRSAFLRAYHGLLDSKPRRLLAATILYAAIGALASWAPFYLLIFRLGRTYPRYRASLQEHLQIMAIGAFAAAIISLPLTYFKGGPFSMSRAFWIGFVILLISFMLASIAGM